MKAGINMKNHITRPSWHLTGPFSFPRDEGRHKYFVEWWYANFHVTGLSTGINYGIMVAYFNNGIRLACITNETGQEYYAYTTLGTTLVSFRKLNLYHLSKNKIDRWYQDDLEFCYKWQANFQANKLDLFMEAVKPPLVLAGTGKVKVGSGGESYYYSLPRLNVTGNITLGKQKEEVAGLGWMDHQYGNFGPVPGSQGYEWFSIQLDNNVDIICYNIWEYGQVITPQCCWLDGQLITYCTDKFDLTALDYWQDNQGRSFAKRWRIRYPASGTPEPAVFDLIIETTLNEQKINFLLYEGTTKVQPGSTFSGLAVSGVGYAELTHKSNLRFGNDVITS